MTPSIAIEAYFYNDAILKLNFNFNFKDMPQAAEASMCDLTNVRDLHHTEKSGD